VGVAGVGCRWEGRRWICRLGDAAFAGPLTESQVRVVVVVFAAAAAAASALSTAAAAFVVARTLAAAVVSTAFVVVVGSRVLGEGTNNR
jgi:hypothetical protein